MVLETSGQLETPTRRKECVKSAWLRTGAVQVPCTQAPLPALGPAAEHPPSTRQALGFFATQFLTRRDDGGPTEHPALHTAALSSLKQDPALFQQPYVVTLQTRTAPSSPAVATMPLSAGLNRTEFASPACAPATAPSFISAPDAASS